MSMMTQIETSDPADLDFIPKAKSITKRCDKHDTLSRLQYSL